MQITHESKKNQRWKNCHKIILKLLCSALKNIRCPLTENLYSKNWITSKIFLKIKDGKNSWKKQKGFLGFGWTEIFNPPIFVKLLGYAPRERTFSIF